ncbi:DUF4189 domain-containing protein [Nocardia sp. KC 131]|uniref:DUF4189 domain-containing protein n=1 Tax=Nocardia arseniciresistens TaxID=3392119 RepID=UPI00398F0383
MGQSSARPRRPRPPAQQSPTVYPPQSGRPRPPVRPPSAHSEVEPYSDELAGPVRQRSPLRSDPDESHAPARTEGPDDPADEKDGATGFVVVFGSILVGVLAITAIIGVREYNEQGDIKAEGAHNQTTTASPASSTVPISDKPVAPEPDSTAPDGTGTDRWVAATYNAQTDKVSWFSSEISGEAAAAEADADCGTGCSPARWSRNGCITLVIGQTDGWGSERGETIAEAESKAISNAETVYGISGGFNLWTKCAFE